MQESPEKLYHVGTLTYTRRTLGVLFFWLLWGDFCFVLMETVVPSLMPLKLKALEAPNSVIGLAIGTIPGIINSICNPVISFRSDRFRSRWGRRIPFIILTLPFLVICLIILGFGVQVGVWLQSVLGCLLGRFSPNTVAISIMVGALALFSFFNTFVNSVFWYLFNDVVPEHLLARFMGWFRTVSMCCVAAYNLFIFKHALTHSTEILVGAALLYCFGFGAMCLKVKEGQYPPPPEYVGEESGLLGAVKTYARECMGIRHYWWLFLVNMGLAVNSAATMFVIFFQRSLGLSLEMVGTIGFATGIAGAIISPIFGSLADRYHPIRIAAIGLIFQLLYNPLLLIWLFWHPAAQTAFYVLMAMYVFLNTPIWTMTMMTDITLFTRVFPRSRFGQFCSANAMLRSAAGATGGVLIGTFLDILTKYWGADVAYRLLPVWNIFWFVVVVGFMFKFFRSWKRYGGDAHYEAPLPGGAEDEAAPSCAEVAKSRAEA